MRTLAKLEPFYGRRCCLLLATCAMSAAFAGEAEVAPSPVKLSGFATLGLTHNDNSEAGVIFSSSQKRPATQGVSGNLDSVLGLQMDWQLLPTTSVVVQGVARAGEDFEPKLRLAYVRQQLGADAAVRLGRMRSPLFFDSDVAEIGYAYLMSRAPIPVYGSMNNVSHLDGGDVQWRQSLGNIAFLLQGYYGSDRYKHRFYNTRVANPGGFFGPELCLQRRLAGDSDGCQTRQTVARKAGVVRPAATCARGV
jgi:hypothetical protein